MSHTRSAAFSVPVPSGRPLRPGVAASNAQPLTDTVTPALPEEIVSLGANTASTPLSLREILASLPEDAIVPIRWLREQLVRETLAPTPARTSETSDALAAPELLTAAEYGAKRRPTRSAEWVRDACRAGLLPGARKDGREWLIPSTTLGREKRGESDLSPSRGAADARAQPRKPAATTARRNVGTSPAHERW
jgi:hypothetical protein